MKAPEVLPGVFERGNLRLPTVIQDYGVGLNGWHEGNALLTPVWNALVAIKDEGVEGYVKRYFYQEGCAFSYFHKIKHTNSRAGGMECAYKRFLSSYMTRGKTILDVGCGQGELGIWCATAGVDYTGIDIALVNVGFAEAMKPCLKYLRPDATEPMYHQGIMESMNLRHDWYHVVFSSHSLEHVHDLDKSFDEMFRVGRAVCGVVAMPKEDEPGEHMRKIHREELEVYLGAGCSDYTIHELEKEHVFWGTVK